MEKFDTDNKIEEESKECGCEGSCQSNNCGCHDSDDNSAMYITLTTDDDKELKCQVLGTFDDGVEATYIAIMPLGDETVYLYGFEEEDGQPMLRKIESDKEYERASTLFLELSE